MFYRSFHTFCHDREVCTSSCLRRFRCSVISRKGVCVCTRFVFFYLVATVVVILSMYVVYRPEPSPAIL